MRTPGSAAELEARRRRAAEYFQARKSLPEIAAVLGVHLVHLQVLRGDLLAAHAPCPARALEHAGRGGTCADRAGLAVYTVGAVTGLLTREVVALHRARKSLALRDRRHVDEAAGLDEAGIDLLAYLELAHVVDAELDQAGAWLDAGLCEVAGLGLGEAALLGRAIGDLNRCVTVVLVGLDLHDAARRHAQHRHGDDAVVIVPELCHADLLGNNRLVRHRRRSLSCSLREGGNPPRVTRTLRMAWPAERWFGCAPWFPQRPFKHDPGLRRRRLPAGQVA